MFRDDFAHHKQLINIIDMLEVERHDELVNKTHGEDGNLPLVGLANSNSASRLSRPPPSGCLGGLLGPMKVSLVDSCLEIDLVSSKGQF
jgi:hypothetical protein